jgi:hypothetical protein
MFANTGPGRNSKSRVTGLKTGMPVTSIGCRSGVHWMREQTAPSIVPAIARARIVFAVPGTSSKRTWPSQASAVRTKRSCSGFPRTTVSRFARRRCATATASSNPSGDASVAVPEGAGTGWRRAGAGAPTVAHGRMPRGVPETAAFRHSSRR